MHGNVTPNCPKTTSIPPFPCARIQSERAQPYARAPPVSLCLGHLPTARQQQSRAPPEDYSSQPRQASFPPPPPPPNAQTKRRQRQRPARIRQRARPHARPHVVIRALGAMRAGLPTKARVGHYLAVRRLGRGVCVRVCEGLVRRVGGWSFGGLGASRFGLRLWAGLCDVRRGAQCGGELVRVDLFIYLSEWMGDGRQEGGDGPDIPTCRISPSAWRARSSEMALRMRSSSPAVRTATVLPWPSLDTPCSEARP